MPVYVGALCVCFWAFDDLNNMQEGALCFASRASFALLQCKPVRISTLVCVYSARAHRKACIVVCSSAFCAQRVFSACVWLFLCMLASSAKHCGSVCMPVCMRRWTQASTITWPTGFDACELQASTNCTSPQPKTHSRMMSPVYYAHCSWY